MRELTPEECEFIAGGLVKKSNNTTTNYETPEDVTEVVVVSSPPPYTPPYYPPVPPPTTPSPTSPGDPGGSGGSGSGFSAAANDYAAQHIHLTGDLNNPATAATYAAFRNALAAAYDKGLTNPNAPIKMPGGLVFTAGQVLAAIDGIDINIGPNVTAPDGADTYPLGGGSFDINVNPNNSNVVGYQNMWGPTIGADYVAFHEIGHVVLGGIANETMANSAGRDLAAAYGFAYPTDAQLVPYKGTQP